RGIPLRLQQPVPGTVEVRGEVIMLKKVFEELNLALAEKGMQVYQNPRNAASGGMRQKDSRLVAARKLNFFAYAVGAGPRLSETQSGTLTRLKELGFAVRQEAGVLTGIDAVATYVASWEHNRGQLPFQIDGIVVKVDN